MVISHARAAASGRKNIGASWLSNACPPPEWMWHSQPGCSPATAQTLGVRERNVFVFGAEVQQDRAGDLVGEVEGVRDPRAVITDGHIWVARDRNVVREVAAQTKTKHADLVACGLRPLTQVGQSRERVLDRALGIESLHRLHRPRQPVLVVLELQPGRDPPVEVGRQGDVPELREALSSPPDIRADAEDLH